jgi:hypothetical protein
LTARLILVDGFAGTGKSSTAQQIWLDLAAEGRRAVWFHEHQVDHPIFQYGEIAELLRWTPARLEQHLITAWTRLARDAANGALRIVEGSFLQIPIGLMLAMNAAPARIQALCRRIDRVIACLEPALVYLHRPDLRNAFRALGAARGARWLDELIAAVAQSGYGRRHGVHDRGGLIAFYRQQRTIINELLPTLTINRLTLDVSSGHSAAHARRRAAFLGIPPATPRRLGLAPLLRHVGTYRSTVTRSTAIVTTDARALYLQQPASTAQQLLWVGPGHFCVRSLPIDVRFRYDRGGTAQRFSFESRVAGDTPVDRSWLRA